MKNTALGAGNIKKEINRFISEAHEKFYYEKLREVCYMNENKQRVDLYARVGGNNQC